MKRLLGSLRDSWMVDDPVARSLCFQTFLYSLALGFQLPGNAVYFTRHTGLTLSQFGAAYSIATLIGLVVGIPAGKLADGYGSRNVWAMSALIEGLGYAGYPLARSMAGAAIVSAVVQTAAISGNSARMAYTLAVLPDDQRVKRLAQSRVYFNVGAAAGGGLAGVALSVPRGIGLTALPMVTAGLALINTVAIRRLPPNESRLRSKPNPFTSVALRDGPFLAIALVIGLAGTSEAVLGAVLPAWLVSSTSFPRGGIGALFVMNTLLVVLLQVPLSKGTETRAGAAGAGRRAALLMAGTCVLAACLTIGHNRMVAIAIAVPVMLLLTGSELFYAGSRWGTFAVIAPRTRRAEYQSVYQLGARLAVFVAPVSFAFVLAGWGAWGWLPFAAGYLALAAVLPPVIARYRVSESEALAEARQPAAEAQ